MKEWEDNLTQVAAGYFFFFGLFFGRKYVSPLI